MAEPSPPTALRLVGVDGCRAGWVSVSSDQALSGLAFAIAPTFAALLESLSEWRVVVAVDIPIGLPGGLPGGLTGDPPAGLSAVDSSYAPLESLRGPMLPTMRRADAAARAFLGPRRAASVFAAPARPTLAATSYREACVLEAAARGHGVGLSQQAYNIVPKIREVDLAITPDHQRPVDGAATAGVWVREVHPEVTFALLAGLAAGTDGVGNGLVHSKRGCATCPTGACPGEADRLALLRSVLPPFDVAAVRRALIAGHRAARPDWKGAVVGRDDIVDAAACLVTAGRIARGCARTFPADGPEVDARGLRMEIVA